MIKMPERHAESFLCDLCAWTIRDNRVREFLLGKGPIYRNHRYFSTTKCLILFEQWIRISHDSMVHRAHRRVFGTWRTHEYVVSNSHEDTAGAFLLSRCLLPVVYTRDCAPALCCGTIQAVCCLHISGVWRSEDKSDREDETHLLGIYGMQCTVCVWPGSWILGGLWNGRPHHSWLTIFLDSGYWRCIHTMVQRNETMMQSWYKLARELLVFAYLSLDFCLYWGLLNSVSDPRATSRHTRIRLRACNPRWCINIQRLCTGIQLYLFRMEEQTAAISRSSSWGWLKKSP